MRSRMLEECRGEWDRDEAIVWFRLFLVFMCVCLSGGVIALVCLWPWIMLMVLGGLVGAVVFLGGCFLLSYKFVKGQ